MTSVLAAFWRVYFRPRAWEGEGAIYERLGVRRMKELYLGGRYMNALVGRLIGRRYRPFHGAGWPRCWLRFTVAVEIGHALVFAYMIGTAAGELAVADPWGAARTAVVNLLVNGYPVMIQRYNRIRLLRLFDLGG